MLVFRWHAENEVAAGVDRRAVRDLGFNLRHLGETETQWRKGFQHRRSGISGDKGAPSPTTGQHCSPALSFFYTPPLALGHVHDALHYCCCLLVASASA